MARNRTKDLIYLKLANSGEVTSPEPRPPETDLCVPGNGKWRKNVSENNSARNCLTLITRFPYKPLHYVEKHRKIPQTYEYFLC